MQNNNNTDLINSLDLEIEKLKFSGSIEPNANIYSDLNSFANTLNLDVSFSVFKSAKISNCAISTDDGGTKTVSTISIYLKTTQNCIDNGIDKNNNWDSKFVHTQTLIDEWYKLLEYYKYTLEFKTIPMYIFIHSFEDFVIKKLVYLCKNEIKKWIEINMKPIPEFIFSSSLPSYNIIFKNKADFTLFNGDENKSKMLIEQINMILKSKDKYGYCRNNSVIINYYYKGMENINLYGLSRED